MSCRHSVCSDLSVPVPHFTFFFWTFSSCLGFILFLVGFSFGFGTLCAFSSLVGLVGLDSHFFVVSVRFISWIFWTLWVISSQLNARLFVFLWSWLRRVVHIFFVVVSSLSVLTVIPTRPVA